MPNKISNNDITPELQQSVKNAIKSGTPLYIQGGGSKSFYGNPVVDAEPLLISPHTGIIDYDPTELCITARAGTRLTDIVELLAQQQQILPFEPPIYSDTATIGGAIAAGISGPRRAYTGSVRDAILGVQIINGNGEIVNFGGQVMKNVAGYDLSRLMVRSLGTLGVILNISVRLLPKPEIDKTFVFEASQQEALAFFQDLRVQQLPISASVWQEGKAFLRISASNTIVESTFEKLRKQQQQMEFLDDSDIFWQSICDHKATFFTDSNKPLWRISLPPNCEEITQINDDQLIEWGGAQRWVNSNIAPNILRTIVDSHNGFATCFKREQAGTPKFPALDPSILELHKQLKRKMDPHGIFNPNRIYGGL